MFAVDFSMFTLWTETQYALFQKVYLSKLNFSQIKWLGGLRPDEQAKKILSLSVSVVYALIQPGVIFH